MANDRIWSVKWKLEFWQRYLPLWDLPMLKEFSGKIGSDISKNNFPHSIVKCDVWKICITMNLCFSNDQWWCNKINQG